MIGSMESLRAVMTGSIAATKTQRVHLKKTRTGVVAMSLVAASLQAAIRVNLNHDGQFFQKIHQNYRRKKSSERRQQEIIPLRKYVFQQCPIHPNCQRADTELQIKQFAEDTIKYHL